MQRKLKFLKCFAAALVLSLFSFTFAFAQADISVNKDAPVNIVQEKLLPSATPTVIDLTGYTIDAATFAANKISVAGSTNYESAGKIQISKNYTINRSEYLREVNIFSPPDDIDRMNFESNYTRLNTQIPPKLFLAKGNRGHPVKREQVRKQK